MIEEKTKVPNSYRVLVCGGRDYSDWTMLAGVLDGTHSANPVSVIIHGAAQGADALAERWARSEGVSRHRFPAQWEKHGKAAGPIRNQLMIDKGRPDLVVAFPGGRGTADMVARARAANIKIIEVAP